MIAIGNEKRKRISVADVDQTKFVRAYARMLKMRGKLDLPEFVDIVKTGKHKQMAPLNTDWFYWRCAAIARRLYFSRTGVGRFSHVFGGNKRFGCSPNHFRTSSRSVIRKCVQGLQKLKIVVQDKQKGGQVLTSEGRSELDKLAGQLFHNTIDLFS